MADSDGSGDHGNRQEGSSGANQAQQENAAPQGGLVNFMSANKIETALWATRMSTIIFTVAFVFPIFGGNLSSHYQKALLSNAATSALRLHQRLPHFQMTREFFSLLLLEDSCHYLFFSIMFLNSHPITMVVTPVFLFALLHATSFSKRLLDQIAPNSFTLGRNLITKVETQQRNMLRFIACNEIFLMPVTVILIIMGRGSLFLPLMYHRFLIFRYTSRRNPYCKQLFYELRVTAEHLIEQPSCPGIVRNLTQKVITLVLRIAPPTQ